MMYVCCEIDNGQGVFDEGEAVDDGLGDFLLNLLEIVLEAC
jgi:hypothetical protein